MENLPKTKKRNGFIYDLLKRTDKTAMYSATNPHSGRILSFEVFKVIISKERTIINPSGTPEAIKPHEMFPTDKIFGVWAWCYQSDDIEGAEARFDWIEKLPHKRDFVHPENMA